MNRALLAVILALIAPIAYAQDSVIGYDTHNAALTFGVQEQPVGIWAPSGLEVSGSLKTAAGITSGIGVTMNYDPDLCSNANVGTQRYNPSVSDMEFCDGTQWQPMGSANVGDYIYGLWTYTGAYYGCEQANPYTGNCGCPPYAYAVGGLSGQAFRFSPWDETLIHISCYRNP